MRPEQHPRDQPLDAQRKEGLPSESARNDFAQATQPQPSQPQPSQPQPSQPQPSEALPAESHGARVDVQKPFGPFVLERRIAVGGSAEVFLARPKVGTVPAAHLVVKRLLPNARESGFDVLEREAELHRCVAHANVVTVFGAGMVGNEPYLAMEYVDGVDLYRLLRRAEAEQRRIPPGLAVYVARRVLQALAAVHAAVDREGKPLYIVHRDVTPSNVYLSVEGHVKLGDFGIARTEDRSEPAAPGGLKGKFGYLAPEQVAGEAFDHRADLFALAALLGEMLLGERVFPGSGQLAVLLAIRDANIEPLRSAARSFPPGLFAVLEKALARSPDDRYAAADDLARALEPFERPNPIDLKVKLSEWVTWARDSSQFARKLEGQIRESVSRMQAVKSTGHPHHRATPVLETLAPTETASRLRRSGAHHVETLSFAKLIEMVATGELCGDDEVALMGAELKPIRDIHELARHLLPSTTATTSRVFEPGAPDYSVLLRDTSMLEVLAHLRTRGMSGALFVQRTLGSGRASRKEMYLEQGRLHHVASSEREELLGEYLVRRGKLSREQLETGLGALARFGGRLGDTLIGLGLVDAVDVFRAIRDQGRDRVAALCTWQEGLVSFYSGTGATRVDFPLDLDLASPMMAGAILAADGEPRALLPLGSTIVLPGLRAEATKNRKERGTAPTSLHLVSTLVFERLSVERIIERLTSYHPRNDARIITSKEACAALVTAQALSWIQWPK
ncbi:MAG TPA: protein kinase [Polyangiaceae bacterium]|nr:protein kinase [Polyangiaceae bacterium]